MRAAPLESPPLNPDPDTARRWLDSELAKPEYLDRPTLWQEILRWLARHQPTADDVPGGSATASVIVVTLLLVTIVVIVLSVGRWRAGKVARKASTEIFDDPTLSAAQHRAAGQVALTRSDFARCVQESFRALARGLQERTIIADRAGLTAAEVSVEAARAFPLLQGDLHAAAVTFDEVIYGDAVATRAKAEAAMALEETVASTKPAHSSVMSGVG